MLLEQKNDDFHQTLQRIEKRLDSLDLKIDSMGADLNLKIDSHFKWTLAFIFGLYGAFFTALAKSLHWFRFYI